MSSSWLVWSLCFGSTRRRARWREVSSHWPLRSRVFESVRSPIVFVNYPSLVSKVAGRFVAPIVAVVGAPAARRLMSVLILLLALPSGAWAQLVTRVVDGDTIVVSGVGTVRLIGVDTPETVDPRKPVQFFGKEASEFTRRMAQGKVVRLEFDVQRKDKYQRTLSYAYLPDGTFLNAEIVKQGFGHAYTDLSVPLPRAIQAVRARSPRSQTRALGSRADRSGSSRLARRRCDQRTRCTSPRLARSIIVPAVDLWRAVRFPCHWQRRLPDTARAPSANLRHSALP